MNDGVELLRALLQRAEQQAHAARPRYRPLRFYIRRDAHTGLARYGRGRPRCTN